VTGEVYSIGVYSDLLGYRAMTKLSPTTFPAAGPYVLNLQTALDKEGTGPTNDGYATLRINDTGGLALAGTLADNTTFSESTGISKNGIWSIYTELYKGTGILVGWQTNTLTNGISGSVYWVKPPLADIYYTNGVEIQAIVGGTNFVRPVVGTQYQIAFSGGTIVGSLINTLTVDGSGQFALASGSADADKLKLSLSNAGVLAGKIFNPTTGATLSFKGAFTSPSQGGSGFVLDSGGLTGSFQISALP
jgi:hypothetical protein